ncbi:MAG: hypothetical protein AVDCRST_MAG85-3727, partial [uncultured Solirubrobacteraceae bacterium]
GERQRSCQRQALHAGRPQRRRRHPQRQHDVRDARRRRLLSLRLGGRQAGKRDPLGLVPLDLAAGRQGRHERGLARLRPGDQRPPRQRRVDLAGGRQRERRRRRDRQLLRAPGPDVGHQGRRRTAAHFGAFKVSVSFDSTPDAPFNNDFLEPDPLGGV